MPIKPKLNTFDLSMIVVSLVIGIGIFRTPAIVAQKAQSPEIFFVAWIAGALISICGGLTFAEIGSRFPVAGGLYKVLSHCFHPAFAFMVNYIILLINISSCAGVAIIGAEYISPVLLPAEFQNQQSILLIALSTILILYTLNFFGIKMGARAQNLLSMTKILMILLLSFSVFICENKVSEITLTSFSSVGWIKAFGFSLISVLFTYGGYHQTINFGADIKDAQKNISRAVITGVLIVAALYLCINFAYFTVLGFEGVQKSSLIASELAKSMFGDSGFKITSLIIFISVCGFINATMLSIPRVMYAMAEDKVFPPVFKKVNEKTQVQETALTVFAVLMMAALFILGSFEKIMNYVMFNDTITAACLASAIFILREKQKDISFNGFRIRFYPLIPAVFIISVLLITVSVVASDPTASLIGFLLMLAGYPLFLIFTKLNQKKSVN